MHPRRREFLVKVQVTNNGTLESYMLKGNLGLYMPVSFEIRTSKHNLQSFFEDWIILINIIIHI